MAYQRKTRDIYEIRGDYGYGHGFETVCSEIERGDALDRLREYRENEPHIDFKLVKVREPIIRGGE